MPEFLVPPRVVNVGLAGFAEDLRRNGVPVVEVDWRPPAGGDERLRGLLAKLSDPQVDEANDDVFRRIVAGDPVLIDVLPAGDAIDGLGDRMILHSGPPLTWERMCGPMQGAVAGAIVFEGWAAGLDEAAKLAASGEIRFHPNHDFGAVGPMTGLTTRSMPVMVVENRTFENRAFCAINEGLGKVMRFGGNDASVLQRRGWIRDMLGPALSRTLQSAGPLSLKQMISRGLAMGDEMHQRNVACTSLFLRTLAPGLARDRYGPEVLQFIATNDQFFLNVAMAIGKVMTDPAQNVRRSTVVTAMSRNGTEFGIRVAGTGKRWFTAPPNMPKGLYFPGFSEKDANPDMGDSAIVETIGLGGFAMAAAPAVAGFIGAGSAAAALDWTRQMAEIAVGRNSEWTIPALDFAGVPTGIDVRRVVESGVEPVINTGIAHREAGIGQVGAGIARAPMACFVAALEALAEER
jgi:hypothetical protein